MTLENSFVHFVCGNKRELTYMLYGKSLTESPNFSAPL